MTDQHVHPKTDELAVFLIPADTDQKCELKVVAHDWRTLQRLINCDMLEYFKSPWMPDLDCGCTILMMFDEDGRLKRLPVNVRTDIYLPDLPLVGDVFLVGYGPTTDSPVGFFSLPQAFNTWEGPGAPLPEQKQPWEG